MNMLEFRTIIYECTSSNEPPKDVKVVLNGREFYITRLFFHNGFELQVKLSSVSKHVVSFSHFMKIMNEQLPSSSTFPQISLDHCSLPVDFVMVDGGTLFIQGSYLKEGEHVVLSASNDYYDDYVVAGTIKKMDFLFDNDNETIVLTEAYQSDETGNLDFSALNVIYEKEEEIVFSRKNFYFKLEHKIDDEQWKIKQKENKLFTVLAEELPQLKEKVIFELVQKIKDIE